MICNAPVSSSGVRQRPARPVICAIDLHDPYRLHMSLISRECWGPKDRHRNDTNILNQKGKRTVGSSGTRQQRCRSSPEAWRHVVGGAWTMPIVVLRQLRAGLPERVSHAPYRWQHKNTFADQVGRHRLVTTVKARRAYRALPASSAARSGREARPRSAPTVSSVTPVHASSARTALPRNTAAVRDGFGSVKRRFVDVRPIPTVSITTPDSFESELAPPASARPSTPNLQIRRRQRQIRRRYEEGRWYRKLIVPQYRELQSFACSSV